jgi:hypothetical protein
MRPALFALVILQRGSCFLPTLAWITALLFYASHHCRMTAHVTLSPLQLFSVEMGLANFLIQAGLETQFS